jgi:hypothetical protein
MPPSVISFFADCPICNKKVSGVTTILGRPELMEALARNADVRVVHMADVGDHQWSLGDREKSNLRKQMAEGLV